ncbi:SH3 domain protein [Aspergillus rambellii]|uniref:SH3 domain protein n=1 Tax=Aspergillus rambellii TaxID=308745 RepID=A0A0F8V4C5_9EURO|nr:SH3 domain protein [Aspergillus rambellii]
MTTTTSPNLTVLPPLVTDTLAKRPGRQRSSSYAKDRLSTLSNISLASQTGRAPGHISRGQWSAGPWSTDHSYGHQPLPAMSFGDGPPYSEDEDLHSPVFSAPRHRKNKSTGTDLNGRRSRNSGVGSHPGHISFARDNERGLLVGMNADGSETYYVDDEDDMDDGPGGDLVTYPVNESRYSHTGTYNDRQEYDPDRGFESEEDYSGSHRYSRDFQFAVGCPDEEMHGKAVALFDFTREHENELPLTEGQVIFVSYRHGQGWLVAEDPRTGESGLVPEEFVRLVRDIEGGLTSLNGESEAEYDEENTYPDPEYAEETINGDSPSTPTGNHKHPESDTTLLSQEPLPEKKV